MMINLLVEGWLSFGPHGKDSYTVYSASMSPSAASMKSSLQLFLAVGGRKRSTEASPNRPHLSLLCRMCEVACNQQKHAEQCRAELLGCRPLCVERESLWQHSISGA